MSLEFNVGEAVARVRRALAVRGRMPLDLDERLGIQVQVVDVEKAPWRSEGARFYGGINLSAVAGQVQMIGVHNVASAPGSVSTHVLDGVWITNSEAVLAGFRMGWVAPAGYTGSQLCRYPELSRNGTRGPAEIFTAQAGAAVLTGATCDIAVNVAAGQTVYVPLEVTLLAGADPSTSSTAPLWAVEQQVVNQALTVYFTGRSFPFAALNR